MTRALRYLWIVGGALGSILLFLLASAAENTTFFEQHYSWLLGLNILVALCLSGMLIFMLYRLYDRYRRGKFGSRLMTRLVLMFALTGILPGAIIYTVSVQFVSRSIESWFDLSVESALDSGVKLGRVALENALHDLSELAEDSAKELGTLPTSGQTVFLARLGNKRVGLEASIINAQGQLVLTSGIHNGRLLPELPTPVMLQQAKTDGRFSAIEAEISQGISEKIDAPATGMQLRALVRIPLTRVQLSSTQEQLFLQLIQPVPQALASNAEALQKAYSEYQVRALSRGGLHKIYIVTLSLTLLLAIFGAIVAAFQISSNLAKPLLLLAAGTRAVAEGNLSPRPIVSSSDELGTLTQSFNTMTQQLSDAREQAERNRADLETAKAYLESVLENMSAGVMVFDSQFRLVSSNDAVTRILQQDLSHNIGMELAEIDSMRSFGTAIMRTFSEELAQSVSRGLSPHALHWQQQIEIIRQDEAHEQETPLTLLARGSCLPVDGETGYIVVFDDITALSSAQRSQAWGEVARRLAHEIKNPLTPIQLSAERLQMRLNGKLTDADAAILKKSTETIVNQVTSMKQMVDDFRQYAQTPPAQLHALDLNKLIEEIVHLYAGNATHSFIFTHLCPDLPRVNGDEIQLRQIIHNLLQNAQDAVAEAPENLPSWHPRIDISTEKVTYQNHSGDICIAVRMTVMDNGSGFDQKILSRIFEPYVTTKEKGTGLGMALVKKIVDEHGGKIDVQNRTDTNGAQVSILLLQLEDTISTKSNQA